MADLLERGSRWLEQQRTQHCSRPVTYVRGAESVDVNATIGRTEYETDDGTWVRVDYTDRDFLILAAELRLAGVMTTPQPGDRIRETGADQVLVFEVIDWRFSDPYRQTFRIETKHILTEAVP